MEPVTKSRADAAVVQAMPLGKQALEVTGIPQTVFVETHAITPATTGTFAANSVLTFAKGGIEQGLRMLAEIPLETPDEKKEKPHALPSQGVIVEFPKLT